MTHPYHFVSGSKSPLLLLHGTGGDEFDLLDLAYDIAPDHALFSVRGNVSENGMNRFFARKAEGVFDHEDLVKRTHELAAFIRDTAPKHGINPAQMTALGFSNGANIAASLFFMYPDLLAGGVLIRAMVPFTPDPVPNMENLKILMLSGDSDPLVPHTHASELEKLFAAGNASVTHHIHHAGHGLASQDVLQAQEWIAKILKG